MCIMCLDYKIITLNSLTLNKYVETSVTWEVGSYGGMYIGSVWVWFVKVVQIRFLSVKRMLRNNFFTKMFIDFYLCCLGTKQECSYALPSSALG